MTAFDSLAAAETLENAGLDPKHAKTHAALLRDAASAGRDDMATKRDLAELKADMTWRLILIAGVIIAAVKLIP
ncbi:MAG: hypothetical protein OXE57_01305 [Alphaproteobacteria bacterium]|nr:hypothetical protein [Alphaproteobacteria bacterium]